MFGLDESIAGLGEGAGLGLALMVAVLLGLRHATDPDHLTAVSTLVLSDARHGTRRAGVLGLCWGAGHAATLFALGLPVVLAGYLVPERVQMVAEVVVGALIVGLAARLLLRWRRGWFGSRARTGGDGLGRTPLASFGIGLVHGAGGSAGVGILLVGAISGGTEAITALALFAGGTALSMGLASALFGAALSRRGVRARFESLVPLFGSFSLLFGLWYALSAAVGLPFPE